MAKSVYSNQQVIGQINSGAKWLGSQLTFGFLQSAPSWNTGYEGGGFTAFTSTQANATRSVMNLWDDLIAPSLAEQNSNQQYANVTFGNTTTSINYAHAYYPGNYSWGGQVWLNAQTYTGLYSPDPGDYYFMTILHEVGHALGLSHPGSYNGGSPTYANNAEYLQDTHQWTVMSYFNASNTGADWNGGGGWQYAQTPMVHDILTIQAIYGADQTTRTGNTTYGFNSNAGNALFDFSQNSSPVLTIYDAGGIDTLDLSGFSQRAIINLEPGTYSSAGGTYSSMTYNIGIANGTWIENATGGSGNDTIYGNAANNILQGDGGNDFLFGFTGNDTLLGGSGTDWVGFSFDFIDYAFSFLPGSIQVTGEGIDSVANDIEWFQFTDLNISYTDLFTYFEEVEVEANGDHKLLIQNNQYFIEDASQNQTGLTYSGGTVGPNSFAGFSATQVEDDGAGGFKVLWSHTSGDHLLWQVDSAGYYQSGGWVTPTDLIGLEDTFGFDLNGDGVMGYSPTTLEINGDHKLLIQNNQYFIEDASQNQTGLTYSGGTVGPNSFAGFSATQVEDDGAGGFKVLWSHTSGDHLLWQVDSAGYYQSGGWVTPTDLIGLEDTFGFDLNGDGVMGYSPTTLEINGDHKLLIQNNQYFIEDASQNQTGLTYSGGTVGPNSFAGFSATQVEDDGAGGFKVLWNHTSGDHLLWQVDSAGYYQSGGWVTPTDLIGLEDTFGFDLNGDGTVDPLSSILEANGAGQNTLSGTDGADTFILANLDIADLITNYTFLEGDDIDLTALFTTDLNNSDGGANDKQLTDFVRVVENGNDTSLEVDSSGSGENFTQVAMLQGIATGDLVRITFNDDDGGVSLGNIAA